jgi:RHS repeat-associated protein
VIEASGAVMSYTYDKSGKKLTQKDANNHVWSYTYDALNRLSKETDPLNRSTSYTYDTIGNLATKTDAKNQTLTYNYNIRRLTEIVYPNATKDTFTYDALGRRESQKNADVTIAYTFDALGRVATQKQTTAILGGSSQTVSYAYDANGNRTELTTSIGTTRYSYDGKNRMVQISDTNVGNFALAYDAMDRRTSLAYPNGVKTAYQYDNGYRLTAIATSDNKGNVIDAWKYTYDAVGNRSTKTDMDGRVETYRYDNVYRLTQASYGDGTSESFTYDPVGNRTKYSDQGGQTITYSFDVANQLLSASNGDTWTYDANGNTTKHNVPGEARPTVTYDFNNRVTNMSEQNKYAPDGTRVYEFNSSVIGSSGVGMMSDTTGNPIMWLSSTPRLYRIYGPSMDDVLAENDIFGNKIRFLHKDALGSITLVTGEDGTRGYRTTYKAFGQATSTSDLGTGVSNLGYTGREVGAWGTMYYRARHYEMSTGRFMQQDSYRGDEISPPSLHRFTYAFNAPVNYVDPSGHMGEEPGVVSMFVVAAIVAAALYYVTSCGLKVIRAFGGSLSWGAASCLTQIVSGATKFLPLVVSVLNFVSGMVDAIDALWHGDIGRGDFYFLLLYGYVGFAATSLLSGFVTGNVKGVALDAGGRVLFGALVFSVALLFETTSEMILKRMQRDHAGQQ